MKKNGQAIVEFVVAIVSVVVLVAAMVQIGVLSKVHTDVMAAAREDAGRHAIAPVAGGDIADYLGSVQNGPDGVNYSADDAAPQGNPMGTQIIAGCANPVELQDRLGDNMMTSVFVDPFLLMNGFVHGHSDRVVPLLPVFRDMVSGSGTIDVKSDVWMIQLWGAP